MLGDAPNYLPVPPRSQGCTASHWLDLTKTCLQDRNSAAPSVTPTWSLLCAFCLRLPAWKMTMTTAHPATSSQSEAQTVKRQERAQGEAEHPCTGAWLGRVRQVGGASWCSLVQPDWPGGHVGRPWLWWPCPPLADRSSHFADFEWLKGPEDQLGSLRDWGGLEVGGLDPQVAGVCNQQILLSACWGSRSALWVGVGTTAPS